MTSQKRTCTQGQCRLGATHKIKNYYAAGSSAERKLGTRDRLLCEGHAKYIGAVNPSHRIERI